MNKGIIHNDKRWYAIRTKFRSEKYVVEQLTQQGIESYIPLLKRTRRYQRKVKHYAVPLISCYVFVKIDRPEYVKVLKTLYVFGFVRIAGEDCSIPDHQIDLMKRIVGENLEVSVEDIESYHIGDQVEIISGGLTGIRGELIEEKNKKQIVVRLDYIGKQVRMTIDKKLIRRLSTLEVAI